MRNFCELFDAEMGVEVFSVVCEKCRCKVMVRRVGLFVNFQPSSPVQLVGATFFFFYLFSFSLL